MKILAFETSLRQGSLAVLTKANGEVVVNRHTRLPCGERTAQSLLPTMQQLLADCGWNPADLDLIAVTTGPGSFTGLRIGATTAKTLAYATGANVVGVHTLATITANVFDDHSEAPLQAGRIWSVLNAERGELFVARFDHTDPAKLIEAVPTLILSFERWCEELQSGDVVAGPPLEKIAERLPEGVIVADPETWTPRAEVVGRLGFAAWSNGRACDPMQLVPNYYRQSAAEEKAAGR